EHGDALVILGRDFEGQVDKLAILVLDEFEYSPVYFVVRVVARILDQYLVEDELVSVLVHLYRLVLAGPFPAGLGLAGFVVVDDGLAASPGDHLVYFAREVRAAREDNPLAVEIDLRQVPGEKSAHL